MNPSRNTAQPAAPHRRVPLLPVTSVSERPDAFADAPTCLRAPVTLAPQAFLAYPASTGSALLSSYVPRGCSPLTQDCPPWWTINQENVVGVSSTPVPAFRSGSCPGTVGAVAGWHDHGKSTGAFLTVSGTLSERTSHGLRRAERTLTAGEGRPFGPCHAHNVSNVGLETAVSVHLHTPRPTPKTRPCRDRRRGESADSRPGRRELAIARG